MTTDDDLTTRAMASLSRQIGDLLSERDGLRADVQRLAALVDLQSLDTAAPEPCPDCARWTARIKELEARLEEIAKTATR